MIDWCAVVTPSGRVVRCTSDFNALPLSGQRGDPSFHLSLLLSLSLPLSSSSSSSRRSVDLPKVTLLLFSTFALFSLLSRHSERCPRASLTVRLLAVSGPRFLVPPSVPERANDASLSVSAAVLLPFSLPLSAIRLSFTVSCDMSTSQYHARHLFPTHTSSAPRFSARVRAVYNLVPRLAARLLSSPSCHFITPVADNFSRAFAFNRSRVIFPFQLVRFHQLSCSRIFNFAVEISYLICIEINFLSTRLSIQPFFSTLRRRRFRGISCESS